MLIFKLVYWTAFIVEIIIRAPFQKSYQASTKTAQRTSRTEQILLTLLTVSTGLLPLIYSVTKWFNFANYSLPAWIGWLGVLILACALLVFARAHADLKTNWSPSLEIFEGHTLITNGIYAHIRHPMYVTLWLAGIAQPLLIQNWIAGPIGLVCAALFYFLRVDAEEKMMLETFGDPYLEYMKKTGGIIPKF
ncbi:MAG: protein-S-isoprenylcysteine O-methyltransferase [Chloroflexota bacterium]